MHGKRSTQHTPHIPLDSGPMMHRLCGKHTHLPGNHRNRARGTVAHSCNTPLRPVLFSHSTEEENAAPRGYVSCLTELVRGQAEIQSQTAVSPGGRGEAISPSYTCSRPGTVLSISVSHHLTPQQTPEVGTSVLPISQRRNLRPGRSVHHAEQSSK